MNDAQKIFATCDCLFGLRRGINVVDDAPLHHRAALRQIFLEVFRRT
jgi:hypothetical protein